MKMIKRSRSCNGADRPKPKTWPGPITISLPFQKFQTDEDMMAGLENFKKDYVDLAARFELIEKEKAQILELREKQKQENDELSKMLQQKAGQHSRLRELLQQATPHYNHFNDAGGGHDDDNNNDDEEENFGDDDDTEYDAAEPTTGITLIELRDYRNSKEYRKLNRDVDFVQEVLLQVYQDYKISRNAIDLTLHPFSYSRRLELKDKYLGKVLRICARLAFLIDQHLEEMKGKVHPQNFLTIENDLNLFKDSQIKQYLVSIGLDKVNYRSLNLAKYIGDFKGYPEEPGEDGACDPVTMRVRVRHRGIALFENRFETSLPDLRLSWIYNTDDEDEFRKDIKEVTNVYQSKEEQEISSPEALVMRVDSEAGEQKLKKKRFRLRCRPSCQIL